jgi:hypothetical protein
MSGSGIENIANGSIDTGDGNDIIMAIGNAYILYNVGTINTGNVTTLSLPKKMVFCPYISAISALTAVQLILVVVMTPSFYREGFTTRAGCF